MKLIVELPVVRECVVSQCGYNVEQTCHARAITVGDGSHPACDTFLLSRQHTTDKSQVAGVGACKVTSCEFNEELECSAEAIRVGHHDGHADCLTFKPR